MAALSNYLENKLIDMLVRGQAYNPPSTVYIALFTGAPGEDGAASEVAGGSYARVPVACNMASWAGTQGAGTTTTSTGNTATTSNNGTLTYPVPSANWGTTTHIGVFDQPTGGNLLWHAQLIASKNIQAGDPAPTFPPSTVALQLDD